MIRVRLFLNAMFIVLGLVIAVRLAAFGLRAQTLSGFIFALALIGLGVYRLRLWSTSR